MKKLSIDNFLNKGNLSKITTYQAGVLQASTHRTLQKHCDILLKQYGISKMHWLVIGTVLDSGTSGVRLTDLSVTLDTSLSYITNAVTLLESKGILMRKDNGTDNRSKLISINPNYVSKCFEIESTLRDGLRAAIYAKINPADFQVYMKVMHQLTTVEKYKQ